MTALLNRHLSLGSIVLGVLLALLSQVGLANPAAGLLTLNIGGIRTENMDRPILIELYRVTENSSWDDHPLAAYKLEVDSNSSLFTLDDLPYGTYAARLYHDLNMNNRLDFNDKGLPLEPFGFTLSKRLFRAPSIQEAKFEFNTDNRNFNMKIRHPYKKRVTD